MTTTADLAGQVAWLYRNTSRNNQMRFDAMAAANYDFTQYTAVGRQPVDREALIAYLRGEIALAEREIALIDAEPAAASCDTVCRCHHDDIDW